MIALARAIMLVPDFNVVVDFLDAALRRRRKYREGRFRWDDTQLPHHEDGWDRTRGRSPARTA